MTPRVSVVVPVRDDAGRPAECLRALAAQTLPAGAVEVVVVDNGSRDADAVRALTAAAGVGLEQEPRPGSYAARNRGVAATSAPVVAFTDADCLPAADWLARGLAALSAPLSQGVVAGAIEVPPPVGRRRGAVELYDALTGFPQESFVATWGFGATANLLVRREVLRAVGPFDARLTSGGDADWGQRATAAGHRAAYRPDVVVRHPARRRLRQLAEKSVRTARGVEQLGVLREEVTPLPEALRRHLAAPVVRLRAARPELEGPPELARFAAAAAVAGVLGAGEVLRGRFTR